MPTTLSERVTKILRTLDVTQTALADYAEVSKGAVNQWLSGLTKTVDAEPAFALQRKTGYSAEWIMFGTGPEKIAYVHDIKASTVLACMERMSDPDKDTLIKISNSLVKPDNNHSTGS